MEKQDLVAAVAHKAGLSMDDSLRAVEAVLEILERGIVTEFVIRPSAKRLSAVQTLRRRDSYKRGVGRKRESRKREKLFASKKCIMLTTNPGGGTDDPGPSIIYKVTS